jgi:cardiolipin synthase
MYAMHSKQSEDLRPYVIRDFPYFSSQGYVQAFGDGPKPLYEHQIAHSAYCQIINQAQHYVTITTPYLIIDFVMKTTLINAALRGVEVNIVTAGIPDKKIIYAMTRSNYPSLLDAGIKIYEYKPGFIHTKMIIADDQVGIIGTINLDYRSLVHNYECGVFMYRTSALTSMRHDIEATLKKSQLQTKKTARQSLPVRLFCSVLNAFQTLL